MKENKCKNCGAELTLYLNNNRASCDYCGSNYFLEEKIIDRTNSVNNYVSQATPGKYNLSTELGDVSVESKFIWDEEGSKPLFFGKYSKPRYHNHSISTEDLHGIINAMEPYEIVSFVSSKNIVIANSSFPIKSSFYSQLKLLESKRSIYKMIEEEKRSLKNAFNEKHKYEWRIENIEKYYRDIPNIFNQLSGISIDTKYKYLCEKYNLVLNAKKICEEKTTGYIHFSESKQLDYYISKNSDKPINVNEIVFKIEYILSEYEGVISIPVITPNRFPKYNELVFNRMNEINNKAAIDLIATKMSTFLLERKIEDKGQEYYYKFVDTGIYLTKDKEFRYQDGYYYPDYFILKFNDIGMSSIKDLTLKKAISTLVLQETFKKFGKRRNDFDLNLYYKDDEYGNYSFDCYRVRLIKKIETTVNYQSW